MKSFSVGREGGSRLFGGLATGAEQHAFEPASNDGFGLAHDARDEFGAARNVVNQSLHLACGPDTFVGVAGCIDHLAARAGYEIADLFEGRAAFFERDDLLA